MCVLSEWDWKKSRERERNAWLTWMLWECYCWISNPRMCGKCVNGLLYVCLCERERLNAICQLEIYKSLTKQKTKSIKLYWKWLWVCVSFLRLIPAIIYLFLFFILFLPYIFIETIYSEKIQINRNQILKPKFQLNVQINKIVLHFQLIQIT